MGAGNFDLRLGGSSGTVRGDVQIVGMAGAAATAVDCAQQGRAFTTSGQTAATLLQGTCIGQLLILGLTPLLGFLQSPAQVPLHVPIPGMWCWTSNNQQHCDRQELIRGALMKFWAMWFFPRLPATPLAGLAHESAMP